MNMIDQNSVHLLNKEQNEEPISSTPVKETDTDVLSNIIKECDLRDETVHRLVEHSVKLIASECGYHKAHQFSVDVLTDVCCDYIKKITTSLSLSSENEDWRDSGSDFVNSLERVFHQMNIPSAANLHQFICRIDSIKKYKQKHAQQTTNNTITIDQSDKPR